jgi:tight adherence protein B
VIVLAVLTAIGAVLARRAVGSRRAGRKARATDLAAATLAGDLAGSVRTGATLTTALAEAATAAGPLGEQVGAVLDRTRRGWSLDDSVAEWARTSGRSSIRSLAHACRFAADHGGDLAVALDGVSVAIGDQLEVADETSALVAQVRTSTAVLAALPVLGALLFALVDPAVAHTLLATPVGAACMVVAGALDALGLVVARWLVARSLR